MFWFVAVCAQMDAVKVQNSEIWCRKSGNLKLFDMLIAGLVSVIVSTPV